MWKSGKIYEFISIVFSAPFIALYVILRVSFFFQLNMAQIMLLTIGYVVLPLFIPLYYSFRKNIEWDYPSREERIIPFSFVFFGYALALIGLYLLNTCREGIFLGMSYTLNGLVSLLISFKYKISIHVIGIMGPATYLLLVGFVYDFVALFLFSLLVSYSRYVLKRHTPMQLFLGYIESIVITLCAYYIVY